MLGAEGDLAGVLEDVAGVAASSGILAGCAGGFLAGGADVSIGHSIILIAGEGMISGVVLRLYKGAGGHVDVS